MAVFYDLRLVSLAVLMLVSQLDSASAAVRVFGLRASGLTADGFEDFLDPYLKVVCGSAFGQTEIHYDNNNPVWSVELNFPNCNRYDNLKLELWDNDLFYDDHLSTCTTHMVDYGSFSTNCRLDGGNLVYKYELKQ